LSNNQIQFLKPKKRYIYNVNIAFMVLPLILLPIFIEWIFHIMQLDFFMRYKDAFLFGDILYIVVARFLLLDSALYIFTHTKHAINTTLMHVVLLYLEITVLTIIYYAIVFNMFDVFSLFHLNSEFSPANLELIHNHSFITSFYISTVTFTTLGSGDWIPQTLNAMIAVSSEVILGVVQGGVFVAIIIYGHQNRIKEEVVIKG